MENAKKILGFDLNANAFARRAPQSPQISQQTLNTLSEIIEKHGDTEHKPPEREDMHQIYSLFVNTPPNGFPTEFDTSKRVRQLAWALTYSETGRQRIVDMPELPDALKLIENRFRISALCGVFNALLEAWDTPNAGMLREFVKKHLSDYDGSRKFVQKIKANMAWYCEEDSAMSLARTLSNSQKKLSCVWSFLELPDYMHRYRYFGEVAKAYVSLNSQPSHAYVADVVDFVEKHNDDATSRAILSKLIKELGHEAAEHVRQPVQSYVLREWQDPRLTGADVRWRGVSNEAKQIFTRWITKEDLRFFFDVVAKSCNDPKFEYRKKFWEAYLEHISFCRPVLRRNAAHLFRNDPQILQYYRERRPATLTGGSSNQHAFIIQMGNYTCVEFSTAAACHVYDNEDLPFRLDDSMYNMNELRDRNWVEHRVIHRNSENYSWQRGFAYWIKRNLGTEPLRSYRLEESGNAEIFTRERGNIHIRCPNENCKQGLRIPATKGLLKITCPKCQTTFEHETR